MSERYRPFTFKPGQGGRLMTATTPEKAGFFNYTTKRDWRRVLDKEVRAEGYDWFRPNVGIPLGNQPYPNYPATDEPITLLVMARRPNGKLAVVAGTQTKLWRYFALENGAYFEDTGPNTPYFETTGPNTPYFDDNPGIWIQIGSGFSTLGHRWEFANDNGYLILNNGYDLPVSYRVEDYEVVPLYELREQGIAAVNGITEYQGTLMCYDISQIDDDRFLEIMLPTDSGTITASQVGAQYSGLVTATQVANAVTASGAIFTGAMVGKSIRYINGDTAVITLVTTPTDAQVDTALAVTALPFFIVSGAPDKEVVASAAFFTASMVGLQILWDSGDYRTIMSFTDSTHVQVDSDIAVAAGEFGVENAAAYAPFTEEEFIDRIQYRALWSEIDEPTRFGATVPVSIAANSNALTFKYPVKSFKSGDKVLILGAGTLGGNLTANIAYLSGDNKHAILDVVAKTTVTDALMQFFDSVGGISGFADLQSDGSGIVSMLKLANVLVVYKDTEIFLGVFTGVVETPFEFQTVHTGSESDGLYYRFTLIEVNFNGVDFHLYAGRNKFYRFDLTTRSPVSMEVFELCKNVFFDKVSLEDTNECFAADNPVTNEIFICFPGEAEKALRFDYEFGTVSTTGAEFTAAANIKRPVVGLQTGPSDDWFIMGLANGTVVRYGRTDGKTLVSGAVTATQSGVTVTASAASFTTEHVGSTIIFASGARAAIIDYTDSTHVTVDTSQTVAASTFTIIPAIWHRLGVEYDSVLASGDESFGNENDEKDIDQYVILPSGDSSNTAVNWKVSGRRNVSEPLTLFDDVTVASPKTENLTTTYRRANYFADQLTVSGKNNPFELMGRIFSASGVRSKSFIRRVTTD